MGAPFCPFRVAVKGFMTEECRCMGFNCALWINGGCALLVIAKAIETGYDRQCADKANIRRDS